MAKIVSVINEAFGDFLKIRIRQSSDPYHYPGGKREHNFNKKCYDWNIVTQ
jgi:hypothetical protein